MRHSGITCLIFLLLFALLNCKPEGRGIRDAGVKEKQAEPALSGVEGATDPPVEMYKSWKTTVKFKAAAAHFYVYDPMDVKYKDFELPDLSGKKTRLSGFMGKPVLLYFWVTTSSISRDELPEIEKLYATLKEEGVINVVTVNIGESKETVTKYVETNKLTFPVLLDLKGELLNVYARIRVPTAYVIDPEGFIAGATAGQSYWSSPEMRVLFRTLAKKSEWN